MWESCNLRGNLWPLGSIHRWCVPWDTPLQSVGWHGQRVRARFIPFWQKNPTPCRKKKKKKDTMFNLPPSSGKKVNLKVGWEILALVADNLLWYYHLILVVCNILNCLYLNLCVQALIDLTMTLLSPKRQSELTDGLLVLEITTVAYIAFAADGIKTLFFPCVTQWNFRPRTFWHLLLRRK